MSRKTSAQAPQSHPLSLSEEDLDGWDSAFEEEKIDDTKKPIRAVPSAAHAAVDASLPSDASAGADVAPKEPWLSDLSTFRKKIQPLAQQSDWASLASHYETAINDATFSTGSTKSSLLLEAAQIQRDHLNCLEQCESYLLQILATEPAHHEAVEQQLAIYKQRNDFENAYLLLRAAASENWDPQKRTEWTKEAARLAQQHHQPDLVIAAWESLWQAGDHSDEVYELLLQHYRRTEKWREIARLLEARPNGANPADELVVLRQLAEIYQIAAPDADKAAVVLERINQLSTNDPIAALGLANVYTKAKDWAALERMAKASATTQTWDCDTQALIRLVADALWDGGRLVSAVDLYNQILQHNPLDPHCLSQKQAYYVKTGNFAELLKLIQLRATNANNDAEKREFLDEAARIAEHELDNAKAAIDIVDQRIKTEPHYLVGYQSLERLGRIVDDKECIARALEGQLTLTQQPTARIELLHRLGKHYCDVLRDAEKAETCWRKILNLDPYDATARQGIVELHRSRADFEALNRALLRQLSLATSTEHALSICRTAAENVQDHLQDPTHAIQCWLRVLDYSPNDQLALSALAGLYDTPESAQQLPYVLEQLIDISANADERMRVAQKRAALAQAHQDDLALIFANERILFWDTQGQAATESIGQLVTAYSRLGLNQRAIYLLDHIAGRVEDTETKKKLLSQQFALLNSNDATYSSARFTLTRRILNLSNTTEALAELLVMATEDGRHWPQYLQIVFQLIDSAHTAEEQLELITHIATIYEQHLNQPQWAFAAVQSYATEAEKTVVLLDSLHRLSIAAHRHADYIMLLEQCIRTKTDHLEKRPLLLQVADTYLHQLNDPSSALYCLQRIVQLDPTDQQTIDRCESIANQHQLWPQFDALLCEILDTCNDDARRAQLIAKRHDIAHTKIKSPRDALEHLVSQFRLAFPQNPTASIDQLRHEAEALDQLTSLTPLFDAFISANRTTQNPGQYFEVAELYLNKLARPDKAFDIYAYIYQQHPQLTQLQPKLIELGAQSNKSTRLHHVFRSAAAHCDDPAASLSLLRLACKLANENDVDPAEQCDLHRLILSRDSTDLTSLDFMIAWHRTHQQWHDLRDRLQQRLRVADSTQVRIDCLMEIGLLCSQQFHDTEAAVETFCAVLDISSEHAGALGELAQLVTDVDSPTQKLRWYKIQLHTTAPSTRPQKLLEMALLLHYQLHDTDAAIDALSNIIDDTGVDGPAFSLLCDLLNEKHAYRDLAKLYMQCAESSSDEQRRKNALVQAYELNRDHGHELSSDLQERIYRSVVAQDVADRESYRRLTRLLRHQQRYEDLFTLIEERASKSGTDPIHSLTQLGRLTALNRQQPQAALVFWQRLLEIDTTNRCARLAMSQHALENNLTDQYLEHRLAQLPTLTQTDAALLLCHLAEFCDKHPNLKERAIDLYRQARTTDPNNQPAKEALIAYGRRLKSAATKAQLLPEEAAPTNWAEYARRLATLGDEAQIKSNTTDAVGEAIGWYRKATIVDPTDVQHWRRLANAAATSSQPHLLLEALLGLEAATNVSTPESCDTLQHEAQTLQSIAELYEKDGQHALAITYAERAFELYPNNPQSALIVTRQYQLAQSCKVVSAILRELQLTDAVDTTVRCELLHLRGQVYEAEQKTDHALADYQQILTTNPLHVSALSACAHLLDRSSRHASAIQHLIRATISEPTKPTQQLLHGKIGMLLEDRFKLGQQASSYYEFAISAPTAPQDLLWRALKCNADNRPLNKSLDIVARLMNVEKSPIELSQLWCTRADILNRHNANDEEAVAAYDMALSYDPSSWPARNGLSQILEKRGEWSQLIDVLEATAEIGTAEHRGSILLRLSDISMDHLGDTGRAEAFLRRSVQLYPSKSAIDKLMRLYAQRLASAGDEVDDDLIDALGHSVTFGPPWIDRLTKLGQLIIQRDPAWAWCLLSPLMGVSQVEASLKSTLQTMRKDYERVPLRLINKDILASLHQSHDLDALSDVFVQLRPHIAPLLLNATALDGYQLAGIGNNSAFGKYFNTIAEAMSLPTDNCFRCADLPVPVLITISHDRPIIVFRQDLIQQLVQAELAFCLTYALMLSHPQRIMVASTPMTQRDQLVPLLWSLLGWATPTNSSMTTRITTLKEQISSEQLDLWKNQLSHLQSEDPEAVGRRWIDDTYKISRRAALLSAAELRQAMRALARIDEEIPRPKIVPRATDLDDVIAEAIPYQDILSFAATSEFQQLLKRCIVATVE